MIEHEKENNLKLFLDFDPCDECKKLMSELSKPEMLNDEKTREDESAKFLRHLTYNHSEILQAVIKDLPKQKKEQEFDFFK